MQCRLKFLFWDLGCQRTLPSAHSSTAWFQKENHVRIMRLRNWTWAATGPAICRRALCYFGSEAALVSVFGMPMYTYTQFVCNITFAILQLCSRGTLLLMPRSDFGSLSITVMVVTMPRLVATVHACCSQCNVRWSQHSHVYFGSRTAISAVHVIFQATSPAYANSAADFARE